MSFHQETRCYKLRLMIWVSILIHRLNFQSRPANSKTFLCLFDVLRWHVQCLRYISKRLQMFFFADVFALSAFTFKNTFKEQQNSCCRELGHCNLGMKAAEMGRMRALERMWKHHKHVWETAQRKHIQLEKLWKEELALQYLAACTDRSLVWNWAVASGFPPAKALMLGAWQHPALPIGPISYEATGACSCIATRLWLRRQSCIMLLCWRRGEGQRQSKRLEILAHVSLSWKGRSAL